ASQSKSPTPLCSWRPTSRATSTAMPWSSTAACRSATRSRARPTAAHSENRSPMNDRQMRDEALAKVPAITLGFWVIKILATTLGETAGDAVTMSWLGETTPNPVPNGYLIGTAIFGGLLIVLVWAQIRARSFNPWLY